MADVTISQVQYRFMWGLILVLLLTVVGLSVTVGLKSNLTDPGSIQRFVVVEGNDSLYDRQKTATRAPLTGSRDIPVYYEVPGYEFDNELNEIETTPEAKLASSNLAGDREDVSNIESRFMPRM
jgi:hypothetical protein